MKTATNNKDIYYMKLALQQAKKAYDQQEVPVGAILVSHGQIIAQSYNQVQQKKDSTAHAELQVLQAACQQKKAKYLVESTLYTTLEPCAMCAMACYWTQIKRLVYATKDMKRGYRLFIPSLLHPKTTVTDGILQTSSCRLLQQFFKGLRQQKAHT